MNLLATIGLGPGTGGHIPRVWGVSVDNFTNSLDPSFIKNMLNALILNNHGINVFYSDLLIPISFAICVFIFVNKAKEFKDNIEGFKAVALMATMAVVIYMFPSAMLYGRTWFAVATNIDGSNILAGINSWTTYMNSVHGWIGNAINGYDPNAWTYGHIENMVYQFIYVVGMFFLYFAYFVIMLAMAVQMVLIFVCILLSPLLLPMLLIPVTSQISARFITLSCALLLWPLMWQIGSTCYAELYKYVVGIGWLQIFPVDNITQESAKQMLTAAQLTAQGFFHAPPSVPVYNPLHWWRIGTFSFIIVSFSMAVFGTFFYVTGAIVITKIMMGASPIEAAMSGATKGAGALAVGGATMGTPLGMGYKGAKAATKAAAPYAGKMLGQGYSQAKNQLGKMMGGNSKYWN